MKQLTLDDVRLLTRLQAGLKANPETGCSEWQGAINGDGYGHIKVAGKTQRVHRLIYELLVGPIPVDLQIDHLCRVRSCATLAHLEVVTNRENAIRGIGPTAINALKASCYRGHPFDKANTRLDRHGYRMCQRCRSDYRLQRKAVPA